MTDLSNFQGDDGDGPPERRPSVRVTQPDAAIRHRRQVVGYVGENPERGTCLFMRKIPDRHYYRVGSGYAMSQAVIGKAQAAGVEHVVLYEEPDDRILVFALQQYAAGGEVPYAEEGDPQNYVPEANAREEWTDQANPMLDLRK